MRYRHGFTVPELLTVVAIIVVILALLLPSLERTREITRRAICANNLHQLQVGYRTYATDNMSQLPVHGYNSGTTGGGYWLETKLADFLCRNYMAGSVEPWYCPSALMRGFATYPSLPAKPTAMWWWKDWQIGAGSYSHRVTGYEPTCHLNPAMDVKYRTRRTYDDPARVLYADANEAGAGGTIGIWSWRVSHDDNRTGPEGTNLVSLGGDVRWAEYKDMQLRWINSGWQMWW
jgi:prepilin-type N-terminal cleavage/methylation domain-containing protein